MVATGSRRYVWCLLLVLLPVFPSAGRGDTTTGLVGWWKFDEGAGGSAVDSSGNGNTGDLTGHAPTWVDGKSTPHALNFNGTSQYVSSGTGLDITGSISISAWIKPSALPLVDQDYYTIVEKGYDGSNEQYQLVLELSSNTGGAAALKFATYNGAIHGVYWNYGTAISIGQWYHVVGVFNGTTWQLWVNNVSKATSSDAQPPIHTGRGTYIGASDINGTITRKFNGALDDVRIYNRALSASDIAELYTYGFPSVSMGGGAVTFGGTVKW